MENTLELFVREGTSDQHLQINADDILNAIAEGQDIYVKYCDIEGDLDIGKIEGRLNKDEEGKYEDTSRMYVKERESIRKATQSKKQEFYIGFGSGRATMVNRIGVLSHGWLA